MPQDEPKWAPGMCPRCGSKDLRRLREGEQEFVIVPKRECRACGTVFSPPAPLAFVLLTIPAAAGLLAFAAWGLFFNERFDEGIVGTGVWIGLVFGLMLLGATVQIVRHRQPKLHRPRRKEGDAPWD